MKFDPSTFRTTWHNDWMARNAWGNGHTLDTDPTRKGWKAMPAYSGQTDLWLLGQRGVAGCATIRQVGDQLDVAVYYETPEQVVAWLRELGPHCDAAYFQVSVTPGYGLKVINRIEAMRATM